MKQESVVLVPGGGTSFKSSCGVSRVGLVGCSGADRFIDDGDGGDANSDGDGDVDGEPPPTGPHPPSICQVEVDDEGFLVQAPLCAMSAEVHRPVYGLFPTLS